MIAFPPERILVSYDFSTRGRNAWKSAQALADRFGASLEAVHVRDWLNPDGGAMRGALAAAVRRALQAAMAAQIPGATRLAYHVVEGPTVPKILEIVRRRRIGLVVIAAESNGTFAPGSAAETLVRDSPVPVLTLKERVTALRSVLVPLDPARFSAFGLEAAARAAESLGARLTLLQSAAGFARKAALRSLERAAATLPAPLLAAVRPRLSLVGEKAGGCPAAIASERGALIVLAPWNCPPPATLGATAELLLRWSGAPVLTLPRSALAKGA